MNLANKITLLRIFLVPIFLIFIAIKIPYGIYIATFIFIVASLTDKLDGYIARRRNQVTRFGKIMDPLADKLLVTSALVSLVEFHMLPAWIAMIIIAREFAITGLRSVAAAEGNVISASSLGKAKTVSQVIAIISALININLKHPIFTYLFYVTMTAAIIITIVSGIDYFYKNIEYIKADK